MELVRDCGTRRVYKAPALCVEIETIKVKPDDQFMKEWVNRGFVPQRMCSWLNVNVHPIVLGCNPMVKRGGCGYVLDYDWVLEATPENERLVLAEIERRLVEHGNTCAIKSDNDISKETS